MANSSNGVKCLQRWAWLIALPLAWAGPTHAAPPLRAALFPTEFNDTSPLPPQPAELARVRALDGQLRELLTKSGRYAPVDIGPVASQAAARELWTCNGCETAMAKQVGAQVSVITWVQKVSDLILNINAVVRDAGTGKMLAAGSVDIRGNTDQSWSRGIKYLVQNRLLASAAP